MALSRNLLTVGALGVGAIALIGAGASATFTDSANATQTIAAGTMKLEVSSTSGTVTGDGKTIILPAVGPVGSTFETKNTIITVKNVGNVPVASHDFQMYETHGDNDASRALVSQVNVCIKSTDFSGTWVEGNGPLLNGVNLVPSVGQNPIPLAVGATMVYSVDFYAGQDSTSILGTGTAGPQGSGIGAIKCGQTASDSPRQGKLWSGGGESVYKTPASLTNAAQGGVVTPTLAFNFTG